MHSPAVRGAAAGEVSSFSMAKVRREHLRWLSLSYLNQARPDPVTSAALMAIAQTLYADATHQELRMELDYLKMRELLTITDKGGIWHVKLTYQGVDIVEYTTPCPAGIGRPDKLDN